MSAMGDSSARGERAQSSSRVAGQLQTGNRIARWWTRWCAERRAYRREVAYAVWDLRERYGLAAHEIALNSARQPAGSEGRQFWRHVAKDLKNVR